MLALVALVAAAATEASAQEVNPSGPYQCVVNCAGPGPATVTQNGRACNSRRLHSSTLCIAYGREYSDNPPLVTKSTSGLRSVIGRHLG